MIPELNQVLSEVSICLKTKQIHFSIFQPVGGNMWKFTASVGVLVLTTSVLIVTAIKGPSWYKSFYNYRHRQLRDEDDEEDGDNASTVFSVKGDHQTHQMFTFEEEPSQIQEEEEDGFFEDPYTKREGLTP